MVTFIRVIKAVPCVPWGLEKCSLPPCIFQATEPVKAEPPGDQTAVSLSPFTDQLTGVSVICPDPSELIWNISSVPIPQLPTSAAGMPSSLSKPGLPKWMVMLIRAIKTVPCISCGFEKCSLSP